ncbi:MAG: hypothetical protein IPL46_23250 [Saprospiraceae bacterium]|nr:hypothetical protein [Saprospiraceae bacterium]
MEGIQYVMDENNRKVAVQISYEKYGAVLDDLIDILVVEGRKSEASVPFQEILDELNKNGNLFRYVPD